MKQKWKPILAMLCGILLLGLLVWRLWPRSLEQISGLDFEQAISLSADTRATVFEGSKIQTVRHVIAGEDAAPGGKHFDALVEQFKTIEVRPSFSNLLRPWLISGFSWSGSVDFLYGIVSCSDSAAMFTLTDRGEFTVGNRLYFITDDEPFTALWEYVTTHGIKNSS